MSAMNGRAKQAEATRFEIPQSTNYPVAKQQAVVSADDMLRLSQQQTQNQMGLNGQENQQFQVNLAQAQVIIQGITAQTDRLHNDNTDTDVSFEIELY